MKKKFFIVIAIFFSAIYFCQTNNLSKEIDAIYTTFNESNKTAKDKILGKYSNANIQEVEKTQAYINDYALFLKEKEKHQSDKMSELKKLLEKTKENKPFVGSIPFNNQNNSEYETNFDLVQSQVINVRNDLVQYFNDDYIDAPYGSTLRTKINLVLDSDGKFKNVTCAGENQEMNLYTSLLIYSLNKYIKPIMSENKIMPANFAIPLTLKFE